MFFIEDIDQILEMYNCKWRLSGVFFFWIVFLQNEVMEAWYLIVCLLVVYHAIDNSFDFVLFVISCLKLSF